MEKITREKFEKLKDDIKDLESRLKNILSQKRYAFEVGGDGWHDNASFEDLMRQEQMMRSRTSKLKSLLNEVEVID